MCGIAGIFNYEHTGPVDRDELRAVRDHMSARGPDGLGEWFSPDGRVALGHRRLSIIDLSERGAQPMASGDGRYAITFNGEIYNYRQLRASQEARGQRFHSNSDTEVLLYLFAEKGERMLHDLRGMFALGVWDSLRSELFLARDAFGIKPLYYADGGGVVRFASLVKALLRSPAIDRTPEPAGHSGFFLWGSVPEPWTLYRGIKCLPAGHSLRINASGAHAPAPWLRIAGVLAEGARSPSTEDRPSALRALAAAIHDSVTAHHVSDVPVGLFLSAGMDSAIIAASAAASGPKPHTVTLAFEEFQGSTDDEAPVAERLASQLGAQHDTVLTRRQDFVDEQERLFEGMDQPSIDGVNTWFVARAARQAGMKVALSGLGGDELFGSYPSFRQVPLLARFGKAFSRFPGAGSGFRSLVGPLLSRFGSPKNAGLLEFSRTLGSAYLLRRWLYMPWELPVILGPEMAAQGLGDLQSETMIDRTVEGIGSDRLAVSALEMTWYMRNQLLRDSDWASMAQSVELRVPFLDLHLLRTAAGCFAAHPRITKREVALVAAPRLPDEVASRPKTGFSVPMREWLYPGRSAPNPRGLRGWAREVYGRSTLAAR